MRALAWPRRTTRATTAGAPIRPSAPSDSLEHLCHVLIHGSVRPRSHSARLLEAVRDERLRMVWDDANHAEIDQVIRQVPRLSWSRIADLFRPEDRFGGSTNPEEFGFVPDPVGKFAALAHAVQAQVRCKALNGSGTLRESAADHLPE